MNIKTNSYEKTNLFKCNSTTDFCNQATYTIEDLPNGANVQWSTSNSTLKLISGQGTGIAKFKRIDNGDCTIIAYVKGKELSKTVWVGVPTNFYLDGERELYTMSPGIVFIRDDSFRESYITSVSWSFTGPLDYIRGDKTKARFHTLKRTGSGFIYALAENACGSCEKRLYYNVISPIDYSYFLSPNGDGINDTWEIIAEQESGIDNISTKRLKAIHKSLYVFNVAVFNTDGVLVYRKDNYMQDSERFYGVGNVGNFAGVMLSDGNYFFTITGSEIKSGSLYIKR